MNVRAIALAVPLAIGAAACQHAQKQGTGTASAPEPAPRQEQQATGTQSSQQPSSAQAPHDAGQAGSQAGGGPLAQDPIVRPGPSIQGHAEDEIVEGHIAEVNGDEVAIETDDGETRTLQIVDQTSIELDGMEASAEDLGEGQPVRASFDTVDGQEIAVKIRARDAAEASGLPEELGVEDADEAEEERSSDLGGARDQGTGSGASDLTPSGPGEAGGGPSSGTKQ